MPKPEFSALESARIGLLSPDIEYLVGVSGGRDSMVLLHWLIENGLRKLFVCHFNHCLRGEESDGDERFVRETAERLGLLCISVRNNSRVFAEQSRQSLETAARESRYRFFARIARDRSCQRVVLAHHADDQVETVLMNLFRGTGLRGLGGMTPVSHREIDGMPLEVIRPFLQVPREGIEQYRAGRDIAYRDDSSNDELFAVRNRLRHELLPLARDIFQRDVGPAILRLSEMAEMESSAALLRAGRWLAKHLLANGNLPLRVLRQLPPAELNQVVHLWLRNRGVPDCGFREVQQIGEMVRSDDLPAKVNLPGDRFARRRAGEVFLDPRE